MSRSGSVFWGLWVCLVSATPAGSQDVVINEILYDSVGSDAGTFTELFGPAGTPLDGYELLGVNGNDGAPYGNPINLSGFSIPDDGYFVIAQDGNVANADFIEPSVDWQNGPDQVVLRFQGAEVDSLCYGDAGGTLFCEGNPAPDVDAGASLTRDAASSDSGDNAVDFIADPNPTPGSAFIGLCAAVEALGCVSECQSEDVMLSWTPGDTYAELEISRNGVLILALPGDAVDAVDPAVPPGTYTYEVLGRCPSGVEAVASCIITHCPPASPSSDLVISEVVDGNLGGGQPRFVEITNCGTEDVNLTFYSVGNFNNGSLDLGGSASTVLQGTVAGGESFIFEYADPAASIFEEVYGFSPDQFAGGPFINGNDVIALFFGPATTRMGVLTGTIIDVYGELGVDGFGEAWEYTDGYARRLSGTSQSAVFEPANWIFGGVDALDSGGGKSGDTELLLELTGPATHNCASVVDPFIRGDCDGDQEFNGVLDALFGLAFQFAPGSPVPPCLVACDADGNRTFNGLLDGLHALNFQFVPGSVPIPPPFPDCGADPNGAGVLGCEAACP